MRNDVLNVYEALLVQSLKFPALIDGAARKEHSFIETLAQWLRETETVMQQHGIAQCARLAGLRSRLVAEGLSPEPGRRKRQLTLAASVADEAQQTLMGVVEPLEARLDEAREAVRQLLGVAYQANMIQRGEAFGSMVQRLWSTFAAHEQLRGAAARILTLVSRSDALRIMAEEIDLVGLDAP